MKKTKQLNSTEAAPRKSLGQHWLDDDKSLEAMCDSAQIGWNDYVLEIGPGPGALTTKLVERAEQVVAIELDAKLAKALPDKLPVPNLAVVEGDILKFDLTSLPPVYKVTANIPYYITGNLIRVLCESTNPPVLSALLVQKEVAERVAAKPGQLSVLAVTTQFYCEVSLGQVVPAKLFTPPPKVDSQILILKKRSEVLFPDVNVKLFFQLVKAGFSAKRKTLYNALLGSLRADKTELELAIKAAKLNPKIRAQALSLDDWHSLYKQSLTRGILLQDYARQTKEKLV